jgi:hypothetical protein
MKAEEFTQSQECGCCNIPISLIETDFGEWKAQACDNACSQHLVGENTVCQHWLLRVCNPVKCDDAWRKNSKSHHTTRAGLLNLRRSGIESRKDLDKSSAASTTKALRRFRAWTRSRSSIFRSRCNGCSPSAVTPNRSPHSATFTFLMLMMPSAPSCHRPREWPHTHHIHAVQSGGQEERRTLAFRDFLREHSDIAREYVALKNRLAALTVAADAPSREAYASAKREFVERIVQTALAAGYPRDF